MPAVSVREADLEDEAQVARLFEISTPRSGAAKITLEVVSSNREVMRLNETSGLALSEPSTLFMTRRL